MEQDEENKSVLDLSKNCLKKVPKQEDAQAIKTLILDDNELQKIDNIDSFHRIEKLSLCKNQLLRMYGVCRLHSLKDLNLSYNGILTIEGLKELCQLTSLNLEGNNIKTIEHLNSNVKLECLNLSENSIGSISDISYLKNLKDLLLHGNRISHLRQCDKYLPNCLETLSLAKNNLTDLNEICTLSHLSNLNSISIAENPCVQMTGSVVGFDYRPFVLNWCMSVKLIDGYVVNPIESLKAEWLYSQGRGRQFRIGEQPALSRYLSSVCPLSGEALENENERKLRLILSKAQQHQRSLQEEISCPEISSANNSPSSSRRKGASSRIQSPRFSRLGQRQGSPDSMSSSYHGNTSSCSIVTNQHDTSYNSPTNNQLIQMTTSLIENIKSQGIMTQSLDPTILSSPNSKNLINTVQQENMVKQQAMQISQYNEQPSQIPLGGPLAAASKMVPVPESLMSPDVCPSSVVQRVGSNCGTQHNMSNSLIGKSGRKDSNKTSSPILSRNSPNLNRKDNKDSPKMTARKVFGSNNAVKGNSLHHENNQLKPKITSILKTPSDGSTISSEDDDDEHINVEKLKTIRNKAAQKNQQQKENLDTSLGAVNKTTENSAILIQKIWRGFYTRKKTNYIAGKLQKKRTQDYIVKLTEDMEVTKAALENERKIQQLQMQAINALWKKVSTMQQPVTLPSVASSITNTSNLEQNPQNESATVVQDLTKTCSMLTNQVQQLQGSMRDVLNCMTLFCSMSQNSMLKPVESTNESRDESGTQTEIIAVHTPQVENTPFPFNSKLTRPSTLPLDSNETSPMSKIVESEIHAETPEEEEILSENEKQDILPENETSNNEIKLIAKD